MLIQLDMTDYMTDKTGESLNKQLIKTNTRLNLYLLKAVYKCHHRLIKPTQRAKSQKLFMQKLAVFKAYYVASGLCKQTKCIPVLWHMSDFRFY